MGTFRVEIEVANLAGERFETVEALADTGATYTMLPASLLASLGVDVARTQSFRLADGRRTQLDMGNALLRINGVIQPGPVAFTSGRSSVLLGAVTLEEFGLGVDPVEQRLIPVEALAVGYETVEP